MNSPIALCLCGVCVCVCVSLCEMLGLMVVDEQAHAIVCAHVCISVCMGGVVIHHGFEPVCMCLKCLCVHVCVCIPVCVCVCVCVIRAVAWVETEKGVSEQCG